MRTSSGASSPGPRPFRRAGFNRIFTETWDFRDDHMAVLEGFGFVRKGACADMSPRTGRRTMRCCTGCSPGIGGWRDRTLWPSPVVPVSSNRTGSFAATAEARSADRRPSGATRSRSRGRLRRGRPRHRGADAVAASTPPSSSTGRHVRAQRRGARVLARLGSQQRRRQRPGTPRLSPIPEPPSLRVHAELPHLRPLPIPVRRTGRHRLLASRARSHPAPQRLRSRQAAPRAGDRPRRSW